MERTVLYYAKMIIFKEETSDGTYQNIEYKEPAEYCEKGRLRRVPDILPVCM